MNIFTKPQEPIKQEPHFEAPVNFVCNICGLRAPQAVLCRRDDCLTELLVYGNGPVIRL